MDTAGTAEKRFYTKKQASAYTTLSPRKLGELLRRGQLRGYRVGKRLILAREDLDALVLGKRAAKA